MARVRLVHWSPEEAQAIAARLRAWGHDVDAAAVTPGALKGVGRRPPAAFVVDLSRLPMQGRDVALVLRTRAATRHVPLVFLGGAPEKVAKVRQTLPDATFATPGRLRSALERVIEHPPRDPVKPASALAGYSGTPLPRKLGVREGALVALAGAVPSDFDRTLGALPDGARLVRGARGRRDLTLWFVRQAADLTRGMVRMAEIAGDALWIVWPKKTSVLASDVGETLVRETGLAAGLVDFKICAVDATWSGLRFTRRKR